MFRCERNSTATVLLSFTVSLRSCLLSGLFLLLDTAECGHVSFEELLDGVLRLRGTAQAIDLATLMYCNKRCLFAIYRTPV